MSRRKKLTALLTLVVLSSAGLAVVAEVAGAATTQPAYDSSWNQVGEDDFTTQGVSPDWVVYNNPTATPSTDAWSNSLVTSTPDEPLDIRTTGAMGGGMAWRTNQPASLYGRWEVRAEASTATVNGSGPAILLWPTNQDWPTDGEIDLAESFPANRQQITNTLHYGANNTKITQTSNTDFTQWHTFAVDWEPDSLTYYIDGVMVNSITNPAEIPHTPMFMALQDNPYTSTAPPATSDLYVDWVKVFAPGATAATAPAPAITSLSPSWGSTAGGTSVNIYGSNLTDTTVVKFGNVEATSFAVDSANEITAVAPTQIAGANDITVTTGGGGASTDVSSDQYTYVAPVPGVGSISPTSGTTAGGTTVTLTGQGFTGATAVTFGTLPATSFTVVSDTEITAVAPTQAASTHNVFVTTAGGTGSTSSADEYTWVAPVPIVTALSLATGSTAGNVFTKITGSGFTGATGVQFGGLAAASYTVSSDTQIIASSPPQAAGTYDITVTTAGGTSAASVADQFVDTAPIPAISSISPTTGPTSGATTVTLTGKAFTAATSVMFGSVPATSFTVVSDTEITAVAPAETPGTHNLSVTTAGGTGGTSSSYQYTYVATYPSVTALSVASGVTAGDVETKVTGTGFAGVTGVQFGALAAESYSVVSSTEILAYSPAQAAGTSDVTVTGTGGTSADVTADKFKYVAPSPGVTSISPTSGPTSGGTSVTFVGHGFTAATAVTFGAVAAASFTVVSDTEIIAVTPPQAAGTHNVYVTTAGGTGGPSSAYQFTYKAS